MKQLAFVPCAVACAWLLLAGSPGRADQVGYSWSAFWRAPSSIMADNGLGIVSFTTTSGVTFWPPAGGQTLTGSSWLTAASLQPIYNPLTWPTPGPVPGPGFVPGPVPTPSDPAVFKNDPFKLILFVKDMDSGKTGSLTVNGILNGSFSPQFSNLTVTLSPPAPAPEKQPLHLGQHLFKLSLDNTTLHLGLPGDPGTSISAHVEVTHNPEPSTLVLAALSMPCLGLSFWRRRQARRSVNRPTGPLPS